VGLGPADVAGKEREVPIVETIEIGIFTPARPGEVLGKPLYVRKHRVRSGTQTITVIVPEKPARGGIDPYNLLDWEEGDNIEPIEIDEAPGGDPDRLPA
jgi:ABC-2 type transport system permease protein